MEVRGTQYPPYYERFNFIYSSRFNSFVTFTRHIPYGFGYGDCKKQI